MRIVKKPKKGEYPPYAIIYLEQVPGDGDLIGHLERGAEKVKEFYLSVDEDKLKYRYEPGKWTMKDILAHIIDDERVFVYRALRFARNDKNEQPGVDQDLDAEYAGANDRDVQDLIEEYMSVRAASITLFKSFSNEMFGKIGKADGHTVSVTALAYLIAGHELHHMKIIRERYLG